MNEFIVWDKKSKKFRDIDCLVWNQGKGYGHFSSAKDYKKLHFVRVWGFCIIEQKDISLSRTPKQVTFHDYIGKKDINNNKIYADCSIVEFEHLFMKSGAKFRCKLLGIFKYDNERLKYNIELFDNDIYKVKLIEFNTNVYDIKIIDTIQENKLGLIK